MKCLAVCQDELLIRTLHQVLAPTFPVEVLVENRTLGRRLHDNGLPIALQIVAPWHRDDLCLRAAARHGCGASTRSSSGRTTARTPARGRAA